MLFALDALDEVDLGASDRAKVRGAIHLLTTKLWPELGDLLGEDEE